MLTTSPSLTGTSELARRRGRLLALARSVAAPRLHLCRTGPFPAGNSHTGGSALHGQFGSGVELEHQGRDLEQSRPELLETVYLRVYRGQLERHGLVGLLASGPEPDSQSRDTSDPRSRLFQPFCLDPSSNVSSFFSSCTCPLLIGLPQGPSPCFSPRTFSSFGGPGFHT